MYKQFYTMLLCREADESKLLFDDLAHKAYDLMMFFNESLPVQYRPNYKSVYKKNDAKIYNWSYGQFYNDLKNGVNHTKDADFENLGYTVSFFSSLNDSEAVGYNLHIGATSKNVQNFLSVTFPPDFNYFEKNNSTLLEKLFERCVTLFGATYGKMANSCVFNGRGMSFDLKGYKIEHLQWLNYFSLKRFDIGKQLKCITKLNKGINCKNGFLKLKEIAIDSTKAEDMELVNKVDEAFHKNVENYFPFK